MPIHRSFLVACLIFSAAAGAEPLPFLTSDAEFRGVEPPDWVLDGAVKIFLALEDRAAIDEAAATGVTVVHAGGPSPYYPLRRDDPASGVPAEESETLRNGIARAKQHGMRVVLGISPYAPVEMVRQHPEWMRHDTDDPAIREKAKLDLTTAGKHRLRSLPLNTPYGDYAIECLARNDA